jgi:hypothetical protein
MNKEMTIVWHDLIEDPSDLPHLPPMPIYDKSLVLSDEVYVQTKCGHRLPAYYRKLNCEKEDEGAWVDKNMTELNQNDIVAWTYIPNYFNREKQIDDLLMKLPIMEFHRFKEGDKTNEYPKPDHTVIIFRYDESKDSIVSTAGFYDINNGCWKVINRYSNPLVNDVIGWSPFFEIHGTHSDNKEQ